MVASLRDFKSSRAEVPRLQVTCLQDIYLDTFKEVVLEVETLAWLGPSALLTSASIILDGEEKACLCQQ